MYAARARAGTLGIGAIALYAGLVACAVVIFANLLFALLTVSFWAGKVDGLQYLFDEILNLAGLPVAVYKGALGAFVSYVIPLGIAATVPAGMHHRAPRPVLFRLRARASPWPPASAHSFSGAARSPPTRAPADNRRDYMAARQNRFTAKAQRTQRK